PVAPGDDDPADTLGVADLAGGTDQVLLTGPLDIARADTGVVALEGIGDVAKRQSVCQQFQGVRCDVKLAHETADGVDLRHALQVAQLGPYHPILESA